MKKLFLPAIALLAIGVVISWAQVLPQPGPPVPIACAYNTTPATLTTGQAGWVQCSNDGSVKISGTISASSVTAATATAADPSYSEGESAAISQDLSGHLRVLDKNSAALLSAVQGAIPAGTNLIGKVGIDQTTPGTTNAVSVRQASPVYSLTISGTSAISATAIPAQGASTRFYMTDYSCSNSGSSATIVYFLSGNAAGSLPIWQSIIPAGGGTVKSLTTPVSTVANTPLIISTLTASTTVYCNVAGYSGT